MTRSRARAALAALCSPLLTVSVLAGVALVAVPAAADPALRGPDNPPYAAGRVVTSTTGTPVEGVSVEYRDIGTFGTLAADTTDHRGHFRVHGLPAGTTEEYALWVDGSAVGHESGYVGCGFEVVATWGEACSIGSGRLPSDVLLDPVT